MIGASEEARCGLSGIASARSAWNEVDGESTTVQVVARSPDRATGPTEGHRPD
jgi:hypothetical protein